MVTNMSTQQPTKKIVRKPTPQLPTVVERSDVPIDKLPQLEDAELAVAELALEDLREKSDAATTRAITARQKLIDAGIQVAVSSREWGHVKSVANRMSMSRTQLARLIEKKHPGFLATIAPDLKSKWGYRGAQAAGYTDEASSGAA